MDLFISSPLQLVADAQGGVCYWPGWLTPEQADSWFVALLDGADWRSQRRRMYDREVQVPRLQAAYHVNDLPEGLRLAEMLQLVQATMPAPYSAVGLNLYRDGRDSVAMHNDKLPTIVPGQPIALVSLGASRRMLIRAKTGARKRIAIELAAGSLLAMSHASQVTHEHGIPKTARQVGARVSVVFRVRPAKWAPD